MSKIAVVVALAAGLAAAQTPAYQGALLIQPGNNAAKCLQADNKDGAPVVVADCNGGAGQKWTFAGGSSGNIKLYGDKCLDVVNGQNVDGAKLQIWTCGNNNPNQNWYYTGDNHLSWKNHGKCVDLTGGSMNNGNVAQVWSCTNQNPNQVWNVGYLSTDPPNKSEKGQTGTNKCTPSPDSDTKSMCQTVWINDVDDFCLWAPPSVGAIGDTEREEVAWCTKSGRGTRVMPKGTLKGVHFVKTKDYVQVTGVGDFTKINIRKGDDGGELDPHGADGNGNPSE
ncbi:hypothetical protein FS749_010930 [Ceratobasidium sp. UAMH 11750]|nr:hypothetical protein FS749_010930 [Ceratobasidium sp. UAMH 11750]